MTTVASTSKSIALVDGTSTYEDVVKHQDP